MAVSQVRRGPEAWPQLGGAARGQVDHALRPLVTLEATIVNIGLKISLSKNIKQKSIGLKPCKRLKHKSSCRIKLQTLCDKFLAAGHAGGPGPAVCLVCLGDA